MKYNIDFLIAGLILSAIILLVFLIRRSYPTRTNRIFFALLICILVASVVNLISAYTISDPTLVPRWINYLINIVYLFSYNCAGIIFYFYVLAVTKGERSSFAEHFLGWFIAVTDFSLLATTPLTHAVFYFDPKTGEYLHNSLFYVLYALAFLLLLYDVILFIRYNRKLNRVQALTIIMYVVTLIGTIIFQMIYTEYLIAEFVDAAFLVMLYISLEKPSDFLYKNTFCYNDRAFGDTISKKILKTAKTESFSVIVIGQESIDIMKKALNVKALEDVTVRMIENLHSIFPRKSVFYLHNCTFAVISDGDVSEDIVKIRRVLSEKSGIGNINFISHPFLCVIKVPELVETVEDMNEAIEYVLQNSTRFTGDADIVLTHNELARKDRETGVLRAIKRALQKEEGFQVFYQPIMEARTGKFRTAEALLRLRDPELGFIPPDEFIPIAEQHGLINEIGEFVFINVCRFWKENDLRALGISFVEVNLSTLQCIQDELPIRLKRIMDDYKMPVNSINLEITETAATTNEAIMKRNMNRLLQIGMGFSLDDFGTGYSNADYLSGLPVDIVKIDKNILWKAMGSERSYIVLENIMSLIHKLGLKSVAEGVETEKMQKMLEEMQCDYYQGFLFSRPISEKDYIAFLKKQNT